MRVLAVGWPVTGPGSADGIAVFIEVKDLDVDELLAQAALELPEYLRPREIVLKAPFPLTANLPEYRLKIKKVFKFPG